MSGFAWPARVYWEDTDAGGIVYYANYLRFLERARTEWLRQRGFSQQRLQHDAGMLFAVVSLEIEYRAAARLDDELEVSCEPQPQGPATLRFAQRIHRRAAGGARELVVEASVRVACLDVRTLRPRRLPAFLTETHAAGVPIP
ncbi:MAG TPA: tol-pal system-associated acyl-CoA thioesterase [Steroidobacteraceae bacterium]|nr:tol-pal system-associated acyl-CoA thioesterase [Steroidobacteraceae bacterium]